MEAQGSPGPGARSQPASRLAIGFAVAGTVLALSSWAWVDNGGVVAGLAIPALALLLAGPVRRRRTPPGAEPAVPRPGGTPPTLDQRAARARRHGDFERALRLLSQSARSRPDDPGPWLAMLDIVITDTGDLERSHRVLRRGLGRLPDHARREQLVRGYLDALGPLMLDERERAEEHERAWRWAGDESGPATPLPAETRRVLPLRADPSSR